MHLLRRRIFNTLAAISLLFFAASLLSLIGPIAAFSIALPPASGAQPWLTFTLGPRFIYSGTFILPSMIQPSTIGLHTANFAYQQLARTYIATGPPTHPIWHGVPITVSAVFPLWRLAVLSALIPAIRLMTFFRPSPSNPGFCQHCGYDLRATPDRCPECGTIPAKSTISS